MYRLISAIFLLFIFAEAQIDFKIVTPCSCGKRRIAIEPRIAGGDRTVPNEFPMMVAIFYLPQIVRIVSCGGTIISESYVLTAAHCVRNVQLSTLELVAGEHDVTVENNPWRQVFKVASVIAHPDYDSNTNDNDIALVRPNGRIQFNSHVSAVCLPYKFVNWDLTGIDVTLAGWGSLGFGRESSDVLRKVTSRIVSQAVCSNSESSITSRQICTQFPGHDSCQHDSGGPVFYQESLDGSLFLVGIISFGDFCATNKPGVNTQVTSYLDWIEQNAPGDYCHK